MRMLEEFFPEFTQKLDEIDELFVIGEWQDIVAGNINCECKK